MANPHPHNFPPSITPAPASAPDVDAEYPLHLYVRKGLDALHADGNYIIVQNDKEKAEALKAGYALEPEVVAKKGK